MERENGVVEIHELKGIDIRNGIIVDGFPSVGLVSSIVANYLVSMMNLEQIGIVDSPHFPTVSLIRNKEPNNPVRIYGGKIGKDEKATKIAVFVSEFQPPSNLIKPIAVSILDWAQKQRASLVISPEGLAVDGEVHRKGEEAVNAYAVGSTIPARLYFEPYEDIKPFDEGVITGVAGVLLNEGKKRNFNVISFLSEAHQMFPDARAAARVIEAMDKAILQIGIDTKPLYAEAEIIEESIKRVQQQKEAAEKRSVPPKPLPPMYG